MCKLKSYGILSVNDRDIFNIFFRMAMKIVSPIREMKWCQILYSKHVVWIRVESGRVIEMFSIRWKGT